MEMTLPPTFDQPTATTGVKVDYSTTPFPYQPQMQRVILDVPHAYDILGIEEVTTSMPNMKDSVELRKKGSNITLSESQLQRMTQEVSTMLIESVVVAVGNLEKLSLKPGDKVLVYLNQLEGTVKHNGKDFQIYNELRIPIKLV